MKADAVSYLLEAFGNEREQEYWKDCFSVCPICGGELEYRYKGAFTLWDKPLMLPKITGFRRAHFTGIEIKSSDMLSLYGLIVRCTTNMNKIDGCPFRINLEEQKYSSFASIDSGARVGNTKMSAYIDNLVDRYNRLFTHLRIDKSELYWRVHDLPLDGMKSRTFESVVSKAYNFRDDIRVERRYNQEHGYGIKERAEALLEIEQNLDEIVEKLKRAKKIDGIWNRERNNNEKGRE